MAFSSWLCTSSTKNMLVKIVHPGGHVELHDKPITAAEVMLRNPRCVVAYPHVFQEPWAMVAPESTLMLGQKFYVVPIATIRKLQKLSLKCSPSPSHEIRSKTPPQDNQNLDKSVSSCWFFANNKSSAENLINSNQESNMSANSEKIISDDQDTERRRCLGDDGCFVCLLPKTRVKTRAVDLSEEVRSSSVSGSSETKRVARRRTHDVTRRIKGSSKKYSSLDHWQPSLESISEE